MAEMLSPGVYLEEIDASTIVSGSSTNVCAFAGKFNKGSVGTFMRLNSVQELIDNYGYPDNKNYNEWFQCYNFFGYGKNLLVSRASNLDGNDIKLDGVSVVNAEVDDVIQEEVQAKKAKCEIAEAKEANAKGNDLTISVEAGEKEVSRQATQADGKYAKAIEKGADGNKLSVVVSGSSGKWKIVVKNDVGELYTKESYSKNTITPSDLTNPYVTFKAVELSAETVQLSGGQDEVSVPRFNVLVKLSGRTVDTSTNKKNSNELVDNQYVKWTKGIQLEVKEYQLEGGVDYVPEEVKHLKNAVELNKVIDFKVNDIISFEDLDDRYLIQKVDADKKYLILDRDLPEDDTKPTPGLGVNKVEIDFNGSNEATSVTNTQEVEFTYNNSVKTVDVPNDAGTRYDLFDTNRQISNYSDFEVTMPSIAFADPTKSKLKILSKNPGTWCNSLRICIAKPSSFEANDLSLNHIPHFAFEGIVVDDLFEYAPKDSEVGFIVYDDKTKTILETYTVNMKNGFKDNNNKSTFIENIINLNSKYVYVKVNEAVEDEIADYTLVYDQENEEYVGKTLRLFNACDSAIQENDLLNAYEVFANKEELDIDIIIANELDAGVSAKNLVDTRKDCICFIGCKYDDVVNKKAADAVTNLVNWRKFKANYNDMFCVACGNYKYMYDRYNDVYRWVNIAGDIAGLRAQTNSSKASWWASAGLERGQLQNVVKLAFNPTQAQRDTLYKNSINPIVTFPGQGTVMWGQKTLLDKASSFDRVNVRGLFNYLERSLSKMAKYQVMEFNDSYTRNRIVSMIKPFLTDVKAGRGIEDYQVICDTSNNTPQIIAQNQLVVDIYIKPTYVAETILLRFTNAGVNSFSDIYTA